MIGVPLEAGHLLGQRTAELHRALASRPDDPAFAPEPFTPFYQRSLHQSLRSQARKAFLALRKRLDELPDDARADAGQLLEAEEALLERVRAVYEQKITAPRIRCHGDYNLREVLYNGRDFVLIDFEGLASRPLSDRRRKYTPLRDVASMLRSFQYAVEVALLRDSVRREDRPTLTPWARLWQLWLSVSFLKGYWAAADGILPATREEQHTLLDFYLLKRAINELRDELTRPGNRVAIPVRGLLQILQTPSPRLPLTNSQPQP
jgi:maltose alpha-D-glucosyltransferase/alpha-amylase